MHAFAPNLQQCENPASRKAKGGISSQHNKSVNTEFIKRNFKLGVRQEEGRKTGETWGNLSFARCL